MNRTLVEIIVNFAMFLEFSDEETLELEAAVRQQEDLAFRLKQLSPTDREKFLSILGEIAVDPRFEKHRDFIAEFPSHFGIGRP